jgi:hypothetical protein
MMCCGVAALGLLAVPALAGAQNVTPDYDNDTYAENQYTVSGNIGGTFGNDTYIDEAGVDFGGTLSYLRDGMFGAEFLAGFAPNLNLDLGLSADNDVNNYMFNVVGAAPLGTNHNWQPFVSGGVGLLTLHEGSTPLNLTDTDDTEPGANIGVGLMGFQDRWGFRTEIRYFTQLGDADGLIPNDFDFWRANAGVAYRW